MEPYVGQIMMFGGDFTPRGWAKCDGTLLSVSANQTLFSVIGARYGGNGRTDFALPDFRGLQTDEKQPINYVIAVTGNYPARD